MSRLLEHPLLYICSIINLSNQNYYEMMEKIVDFTMTRLFQMAEYVLTHYTLMSSNPATPTTPQQMIPTIRFPNEDKMVEGDLFA